MMQVAAVSRVVAPMGALVAVLVTAACGPEITGAVGVGVDERGEPVGYVQACRGVIDGADLFAEASTRPNEPAIGKWDAHSPARPFSSWSLVAPTDGWTTTRAASALQPEVVYSLMAGANDNSGSAGSVLFTLEDLEGMKPGQVRIYDGARADASAPATEPTGSPVQQARDENMFMKVVTVAEFRAQACADS